MTKPIRVIAAMSLATVLFSIGSQRVLAVPPAVMMFHGEPLANPIFVTGKDTLPFGDLFTPLRQATRPSLDGRKFVSVAIFSGPIDNPAHNGTPLARLTPQMATQHARLYFATATLPAVMMVTDYLKQMSGVPPPDATGEYRSPHVLSPEALAVLKRLGVPTGPSK